MIEEYKGPFFIDVNQNPDIFYPPSPPCQLLSYYPLNNSNCLSTFEDPPPPFLVDVNIEWSLIGTHFLQLFKIIKLIHIIKEHEPYLLCINN